MVWDVSVVMVVAGLMLAVVTMVVAAIRWRQVMVAGVVVVAGAVVVAKAVVVAGGGIVAGGRFVVAVAIVHVGGAVDGKVLASGDSKSARCSRYMLSELPPYAKCSGQRGNMWAMLSMA